MKNMYMNTSVVIRLLKENFVYSPVMVNDSNMPSN